MTTAQLDLLGAITAQIIFISSIVTFAARILWELQPGHWVGIPILLTAFPLGYLLIRAPAVGRPALYYLQVGLMLTWLIALFLLDYVYRTDWRVTRTIVIPFVVLYFAGTGGMIGVASLAGRAWMISSIVLFFVAAVLAFVQRAITGL